MKIYLPIYNDKNNFLKNFVSIKQKKFYVSDDVILEKTASKCILSHRNRGRNIKKEGSNKYFFSYKFICISLINYSSRW